MTGYTKAEDDNRSRVFGYFFFLEERRTQIDGEIKKGWGERGRR